MKNVILLAVALISFSSLTAQQNQIELTTSYGSDNKEMQQLMRFQGVETIDFKFKGSSLKGKDYSLIVKQFKKGKLVETDTVFTSKAASYFQPIDTSSFSFNYFVQTRLNNTVKMHVKFDSFGINPIYDIRTPRDKYALHDFTDNNRNMTLKVGEPTYIMGYFLPYLDKETGWKKYCDVAGSKYNPEEWGKVFKIPNYFLVEIVFE